MSARVTITLDEMMLLKASARGFSFLPRQPVSSLLAGRHTSRLRGRGLSFEELRHYHQGDDIRLMDWKATARLRSPYIRVYNEERERPVFAIVDQRSTMFFGSRRQMKSVAAAELAGLAGWRALDVGDRIGGIIFNEQELTEIRPHGSQTRLLQLFHQIVKYNHRLSDQENIESTLKLNDVLQRALSVVKHDHLVVLISDLAGADHQTQKLATQLAAHNDVLICAVYDPLGIKLTGSRGMVANQGGKTWKIPTDSKFPQDFEAEFQQLLNKWREIFRSLKIPLLPVSTAYPVVDQVRALLGQKRG